MATIATLSERYLTSTNPLSPEDNDWRLFIHDHKANILSNSVLHAVDLNAMIPYEYRPAEYLTAVLKADARLDWIFLFINNLATDIEFTRRLTSLWVPDLAYITDLRQTYQAIVAASKKRLS